MAQTVSIPPNNPSDHSNTTSHDPTMHQNGLHDQDIIMHFSHPHRLSKVYIKEDEENEEVEDEESEENEEVEDEEDEKDEEDEESEDVKDEESEESEENEEEVEDKEAEKDEEDEESEEDVKDEESEEDVKDEESEENEGYEVDKDVEDNEEDDEDEKDEGDEEDEDDEVICAGCKETLVGDGYSCVEPKCNFHLHESCFNLQKEIHHKSHPKHPLALLPVAPYDNEDGYFTCNACSGDGTGFTYHCSICKLDLHTQCAGLPETVKRDDHEHTLKLLYSCPVNVKDEDTTILCDVCYGDFEKDCWVYYCEPCDYGTHLDCVDSMAYSSLDPETLRIRLEFQMDMMRTRAELLGSLGRSLANLAG